MNKLLLIILVAIAASADAITITWNQNIDPLTGKPDLTTAGYNVYLGTAPGKEVFYKKLGLVLTYTFPPQATGAYFVYVSAYNTSGFSGLISNEEEFFVNTPTPPANVLKISTVDP
jgi:hypothetical protein